ncbi:MAG: hypothetical protein ACR2RE_03565 [Geminicoccaceae bacterium]
MRDLWRLVSGLKGDVGGLKSDVSGLKGDVSGVEARLSAKIDAVGDELKGEAQAIRNVVDELPSENDFQELDRKVAVVANDTKATRIDVRNLKAEVSRLRADVKAAGIPVR